MDLQSPHARILSEVKSRLDAMKEFRLIDEYHSQPIETVPKLAYPAVLVDIEECTYDELGEGSQSADSEISVRIYQANYSQSSQKAPEKSKKQALSVYELEAKVVAQLHGWAPTVTIDKEDHQFTSPFIRMSSRKGDEDQKGLRCRELVFSTSWEESFDEKRSLYPSISINGEIIP